VIRKRSPTSTSSAAFLLPLLLCAAMDDDVVFYRTQKYHLPHLPRIHTTKAVVKPPVPWL
jgi:hypothetical protein